MDSLTFLPFNAVFAVTRRLTDSGMFGKMKKNRI